MRSPRLIFPQLGQIAAAEEMLRLRVRTCHFFTGPLRTIGQTFATLANICPASPAMEEMSLFTLLRGRIVTQSHVWAPRERASGVRR